MRNIISINYDYLNKLSVVNKNGSFSTIYKLNDGKCLKIWKEEMGYDIEEFSKFTKLKINCAIFPEKLVLLDGKFMGYTMNYVNGVDLESCDNFDYSLVVKKYTDLINMVTNELAELGIMINDVHSENIIWDNHYNKFTMIDIDRWYFSDVKKRIVAKCNFNEMRDFFASFIFDNGNPYYYDALNIDSEIDFINFYENTKYDIEKIEGKKIDNLNDVKKVLRRM